MRPVRAEIDLGAVRHNVALLVDLVGSSALCAVVKADGYGHGSAPVARAALAGGATWLGVALVSEGRALRDAGIDAPILVLSEAHPSDLGDLVAAGLTPVVYRAAGIAGAASAVRTSARSEPLGVHLKVNTGMNRVGVDPSGAVALADAIAASPELRLEGLMTHLAVADEPDDPFTAHQIEQFAAVEAELAARGHRAPVAHLANSAGTLLHPEARRDLVRCGIAIYGIPPAPGLDGIADLRPALSLRAEITHLRVVEAGARVSYGLHYEVPTRSVLGVVPIGYADGVPRRLGAVGATVLVGGRRVPIAGAVTMDQLVVDLGPPDGPAGAVEVGDEVVLLGAQGGDRISPDEWAGALGTISYEIVCGIRSRVPRRHVEGGG